MFKLGDGESNLPKTVLWSKTMDSVDGDNKKKIDLNISLA